MNKIKYIVFLNLSFILLNLTGCRQDEPTFSDRNEAILFRGRIMDSNETGTRGPASSNISYDFYSENFYLDMITENGATEVHKCRVYRVPEKTSGVLHPYIPDKDEQSNLPTDSLIWQSKYNDHSFYAWNLPWLSSDEDNIDPFVDDNNNKNEYARTRISFHPDDEMYQYVDSEGVTVNNYSKLEKFIGAKVGPVNSTDNGEYVNLQFQHLVSKLFLNIRYYENNTYRSIAGKITLEGLPSEGYFERNNPERPKVVGNSDFDKVTYDFSTSAISNCLYICPDVDFSKIKYRIISTSSNITTSGGEFLGDFSALELSRDLADFWEATHSDPHVLYAGEVLTLNITLRQGVGTEVSLSVSGWNSQAPREGYSYPNDGIYERNEWDQINNSFSQTGSGGYDDKADIEDELFKKFGNEDTGEYDLFTDIEGVSQRIKIGKKYTLNGMGHTVTFSSYYTSGSNSVRISRMRDIYLVGPDGKTLYIDENYNIFKVDENGNLIPTGNSLSPDLAGTKYNCYYLNFEDGSFVLQERY